jgi:ribosomal protein S18 acetylase RimI-like enzyme
MEIAIRKIEQADAETLSSIAKESFFDTFTGTCTEEDMQGFLEEYFNVPLVEKELMDEDCFNFFALVDNIPVGYIRFKEDYTAFPYIKKWKALELKRLYILTPFHGKGIAQALMNIYMDHVIKNGYEAAWLGVWEYNFKAQKFYNKYGFEDSGYSHDFPIGNTPQTDKWFWKFIKW